MKKKLLLVTIGLFFSVVAAHAGSVDTFGIGAKATALGGAYAAYADDPYAVYYNPAGLAQIEGAVISAGAHVLDPEINMMDFKVNNEEYDDFSDESPILTAPHLGYAHKLNERFSVGLAVYAPWGLELEWEEDPKKSVGAVSAYHSYYKRYGVTPGFSFKLSKALSIGAGVTIGRSEGGVEAKENRVLDVNVELEDSVNYSYNVGVMIKPTETISVGLTYRSETDADFEGDVTVKMDSKTMFEGKGELDYNHPQQVQAGVRYQPHDKFSIECDIVWTDWSINEHQTVDLDKPLPTTGKPEIFFAREWEDTKQLRFGMEYKANDILTLRSGYFYDPTPIPDNTLDLQWPDADKKTYSVGAGLHFGKFTIDTVFQYTDIEKARVIGGESENLNHSYELKGASDTRVSAKADGHIIGGGVTLSYNF